MEFKTVRVADLSGNVMKNADVRVYRANTTTEVTVFDENGVTLTTAQLKTDANGAFGFKTFNGVYDIVASLGSTTATVQNVQFNDPPAYTTVAAFFADIDAGYTAPNGTVVPAGPVQFQADSSASVTGLPAGWDVYGKPTPVHFGAVGDGATDDAAAVQNWLRYVVANNKEGYVPAGDFLLNTAVTATAFNSRFKIEGAGRGVAIFRVPASNVTGGILIDATDRASQITASDFTVLTEGVGNGTGFRFTLVPGGNQHQRSAVLTNVEVKGVDITKDCFDKFIDLTGNWRPLVTRCVTGGPFGPGVSSDLSNASPMFVSEVGLVIDNCYDPAVEHCHFWSSHTLIRSIGTDQEAMRITDNIMNGCRIGVDHFRTTREPIVWMDNNHINARDDCIRIDGARLVTITGTQAYNEDAAQNYAGVPHDIHLKNTEKVILSGNTFHFPGNPDRINVFFDSAVFADTLLCSGNIFNATASEGIRVGVGATNVTISDNTFSGIIGTEVNDLSGGATIVGRSAVGEYTLESQADSAADGPFLSLLRRSASPAVNDALGQIRYRGMNTDAAEKDFALTRALLKDPTAGAEDGELQVFTSEAGTLVRQMSLGNGAQIGSPTGSAKGTGTLNVQGDYWKNGQLLDSVVRFDTVAAFFASGHTATDGSLVRAGDVQFQADSSASVTGLPVGWDIYGVVTPQHFGAVEGGDTTTPLRQALEYAFTKQNAKVSCSPGRYLLNTKCEAAYPAVGGAVTSCEVDLAGAVFVVPEANTSGGLKITRQNNFQHITIKNLTIHSDMPIGTSATATNGIGLEVTSNLAPGDVGWGTTEQSEVTLIDCRVHTTNPATKGRWASGIVVRNAWWPQLTRCWATTCHPGPNTADAYENGVGIHVINCFQPTLTNCQSRGRFVIGIRVRDEDLDANSEDFQIIGTYSVGSKDALDLSSAITGEAFKEPGGAVIGGHYDGSRYAINIENRRQAKILGPLLYLTINAAEFDFAGAAFCRVHDCQDCDISVFVPEGGHYVSPTNATRGVSISGVSDHIRVSGSHFGANGIAIAHSSSGTNNKEWGNTFGGLVVGATTGPTFEVVNGATPILHGTGSTPILVANLPTASSAGRGSRYFVSDATATTFASVVAGGGANAVPVYSDGTNWRIG